ncbi:hypothetical protein B0T25DRAFT_597392 [Lasiosphaeria hispida]|uniref:PD-(D/E)XK nuclease-like domain-containing protein n=1 Tax=Lasiosphaeria hispida TaxID=260671 RepID=A0AAJ0HVV5_9PEZI|nr:hypothetical protein B0T25DRAFT_597392 [Lasiosphaeria hispida]
MSEAKRRGKRSRYADDRDTASVSGGTAVTPRLDYEGRSISARTSSPTKQPAKLQLATFLLEQGLCSVMGLPAWLQEVVAILDIFGMGEGVIPAAERVNIVIHQTFKNIRPIADFCTFYVHASSIPDPAVPSKGGLAFFTPRIYKQAAERLLVLRSATPYCSINQTDYSPFCNRPIVVSVWQMAQWRALRFLCGIAIDEEEQEQDLATDHEDAPEDQDQKLRGEKVQDMLDEVDFLPAIIVQGHDWWFVASTMEGSKTILWTKKMLGSTDEARGIYQIVCTLQYLAAWSRYVYWPWFARRILKVGLE